MWNKILRGTLDFSLMVRYKKPTTQSFSLRIVLYSLFFLCAVLGLAQDEQRDQAQFQERFLLLEPPEQVVMWLKQKPSEYADDMEGILIARGESGRYIAQIVRNPKESLFQRWRAMKLLCDMDRYVPTKEFPIPAREEVYLPRLNLSGVINRNAPVDGHRIGKEAYETLQWAATQTKNQEVRFHARDLLGLLDADFHAMPVDEKVERWARAVERNRGNGGGFVAPDEYVLAGVLQIQLIQDAPKSISLLANLLTQSHDGWIRDSTLEVLEEIDAYRVRLRGLPEGRAAIEAARKAIEEGNLGYSYYRDAGHRAKRWEFFYQQVMKDRAEVNSWGHFSIIPLAFHNFYRDPIASSFPNVQVTSPDEWARFIGFMTDTDPYFPSWEYCHMRNPDYDEMFEPRFREKMARYHEQWVRFKSQGAPHAK